jgi:large subunit ribosomal protein L24
MSLQKIKVGDTVQVMSGAERSLKTNRGKILSIDKEANRVRVEGLRLVKRHIKKGRDRANPEGGIVESAGTIALSAVSLVCPKCDKPTRVGARVEGDKKVRVCKQCDKTIDGK